MKITCIKYSKEVRRVQMTWAFFLFCWLAEYLLLDQMRPANHWHQIYKHEAEMGNKWTGFLNWQSLLYSDLFRVAKIFDIGSPRNQSWNWNVFSSQGHKNEVSLWLSEQALATYIGDWFFFPPNVKCQLYFPSISAFLETDHLPVLAYNVWSPQGCRTLAIWKPVCATQRVFHLSVLELDLST